MNNSEIIASCFFVPRRKAPKMLHAIEENLYKMPLFVEFLVIVRSAAPGRMRANHSLHTVSLYGISDAPAIICSIGQEVLSLGVIYQFPGHAGLMALSRSERYMERLSECVYESVDFRRKTSSRASQSIALCPPFPPAAC